jgi:hypothetical protein
MFTGGLFAQSSKTIYFDADWNKTYRGNHSFYRIVRYGSNGGYIAPFYDYYKDGTVQAKIDVDSYNVNCGSTPWDCSNYGTGFVTTYFRSGKTASYMRVKGGKRYGGINYTYYGGVEYAYGCISGDCEDGYGTYHYQSGDSYVGYFYNSKRHGSGRYTWASGREYAGSFTYDQIERKSHANTTRRASSSSKSDWTLEDTKTALEIGVMLWDFFSDDGDKKKN